MPAILRREDQEIWLKGTMAQARAMLAPYPADLMVAHPVSTRVNSVRNNGPELIEPIAA
jgi:putative SOS response-associated peptidase YedK